MNSSTNKKIDKYLDELADEYKKLLFNALVSRSNSLDDLSVSELLRLDNEIKKPLLNNYHQQQRRRRLLLIYGLAYIFIGFFSFIMYCGIKTRVFFDPDGVILLISLVISMIGLITTIYSFLLPVSRRRSSKSNISQSESSKLLAYNVIAKWRELEGITNDFAESNGFSTPRSIIEYLFNNRFIDENEVSILKDYLKMRNNIVHSSDIDFSSDEMTKATNEISQIISKLRKIL